MRWVMVSSRLVAGGLGGYFSAGTTHTEINMPPDAVIGESWELVDREEAQSVSTDGTDLRQITPWKLDAASPDWSPDGTKIAFNSYWDQQPGKSANVYVVNSDGTRMKALTRDVGGGTNSFRPSWAPDGTKLVIARAVPKGKQGRLDLYLINRDGSGLRRLTSRQVDFAATPDWGPAP